MLGWAVKLGENMEPHELKQFIEEVIKQVEEGATSQGYQVAGVIYFDEMLVWDREHNLHKVRFEVVKKHLDNV